MLANLNRVTITGYLVRDPTLRIVSARSVGDMRIACHRGNQAEPGGPWVQWVDYCDVRVYGSFAHVAYQRLREGSSVAIEGLLSSQPIYCENPKHKQGMFVLVQKMQFLSPRLDASPRSDAPPEIDAPIDAPSRSDALINAPLGNGASARPPSRPPAPRPLPQPPRAADAPKRRARFSYGSIDAS